MIDGKDFKSDGSMALLLMGAPGAGKTNVAFEFPDPLVIDWGDANVKSAVERHPGKTWFYERVDVDDAGKEVPPDRRWERGSDALKRHGGDPRIRTIVDDSLSMLQVALCDHIVRLGGSAESPLTVGGIKVMTRSLWMPFSDLLRKRVIYARSLGKPYVMVCHEKVDSDDMTGVKGYRPNLSGQLGDSIASLFTDFWSCETDPSADPKKYATGVRYYVRTAPTNRAKLKCSCGLPANFEFTWEAFERARGAGAVASAKGLDKSVVSS